MSGWQDLDAELAAWASSGREVTLWWRDDDAAAPDPALDRLLSAAARLPLGLAVIPAAAGEGLAERLSEAAPSLQVLQHGFSHINHAAAGRKKMELGTERPLTMICEDLARGQAILRALFPGRSLPILVPPWNRVREDLVRSFRGWAFVACPAMVPGQPQSRSRV